MKFIRKFFKDETGLTLLEVLVATVILGVAVAAMFNMFVVGSHIAVDAQAETQALNLAQKVLEEYRAMPYGEVVSTTEPQNLAVDGYIYTVDVVEGESSKTVTVTVSYPVGGRTETLSLTMERVNW
ncbi:MAG: prepilin-type N-terminal cleavage/methylation domain-containing protein [Peptococcaceae bacterium]|nr:prepilin-type N-terminal cleavage/methylation domain-containing protein [Peptococcaceae bacterium]